MKLIVGLGNSGEEYEDNRHNVGFMVVDEIARKMTDGQWLMTKKFSSSIINHQSSIIFVKPQTFMNNSGEAVASLATYYKLPATNIYVVHDDLDIELGEYIIQKGKGPKVHKGLLSIYEKLGSKDFWHVRIGVENRGKENRIPGEKYVLQDFTKEELEVLRETLDNVSEELLQKINRLK